MNRKARIIAPVALMAIAAVVATSCKDDETDVGASIQPESDRLDTYSSMVEVGTENVRTDSVLSKADYLFMGQYTDQVIGATQAEFMTQIDSRIDGITLPDTTISSQNNKASGSIDRALLSQIDTTYGDITAITDPSGFTLDSAFFYVKFADDFVGDSTSLQAIDVYALTKPMPANARYFTNTKAADYCDMQTLLGTLAYRIKDGRELRVPLDRKYAEELSKIYLKGNTEGIRTQGDFNKKFMGLYVKPSFNEGAIVKVTVAGLQLFYHYDAKIHTTIAGAMGRTDTVVDSRDLPVNPLTTSLFLSANKSVERVNIINRPESDFMGQVQGRHDYSYCITPAGTYTEAVLPLDAMLDSVAEKAGRDYGNITINSSILVLKARDLDWSTKMVRTPNKYMLLIDKQKVNDFFYSNSRPDGEHSMAAVYDTASRSYMFDLSRATQLALRGDSTVLRDMVVVPIYLTTSENQSYYHQQLWIGATRLYGNDAADIKLRPRIDMVYTRKK